MYIFIKVLHVEGHIPFAAGVNAHSLDYRKSAGGFIHGYRYTGNY